MSVHSMPSRESRRSLVTFLLFVGLLLCWSVATPPFGGPDEDGHVFRAVSIAEGSLVNSRSGPQGYDTPVTLVSIPAALLHASNLSACRVGFFGPSTSCAKLSSYPSGDTLTPSGAARYNPVYYLFVGLGSDLVTGNASDYLERALSILLCAALLATALGAARRAGSVMGQLATLLAMTPMSLFLMGSVNPNAVEVAAACGLWALGLGAATAPDAVRPRAWYGMAACASIMVMTRSISTLWLVVIVAALLMVSGRRGAMRLTRSPHALRAAGLVVAAVLLNLAWTLYSNVLAIAPPAGDSVHTASLGSRLGRALGDSGVWAKQAFGVFGYGNVKLSGWVYVAALVMWVGFWIVAAPSRRRQWQVALLFATIVALSAGLEAADYNTLGQWWQGRYVLPLLVGVPMMLAAHDRDSRRSPRGGFFSVAALAGAVVLLDLVSLHALLHRAVRATTWARHTKQLWQLPVPAVALMFGAGVCVSLLAADALVPAWRARRSAPQGMRILPEPLVSAPAEPAEAILSNA